MKDVELYPELWDEAYKAYIAWCDRNNFIPEYPSLPLCEIGTRYVYIRNSNGLLAKFDLRKKEIVAGA